MALNDLDIASIILEVIAQIRIAISSVPNWKKLVDYFIYNYWNWFCRSVLICHNLTNATGLHLLCFISKQQTTHIDNTTTIKSRKLGKCHMVILIDFQMIIRVVKRWHDSKRFNFTPTIRVTVYTRMLSNELCRYYYYKFGHPRRYRFQRIVGIVSTQLFDCSR